MILVIGNKGSFSLECRNYLSKKYTNVELLYSQELDVMSQTNLEKRLGLFFEPNARNKLVYVGGEIRNKSVMQLHNVDIPLMLSRFCTSWNIQFILLGSLSQWGLVKWKRQVDIYNNTPVYKPYDEYSRTKQKCYLRIKSSSTYSGFFVSPASILNHKHRSGSIYTLKKFMSSGLINCIFEFSGMISYCERLDVYGAINEALISNRYNGNLIVSNSVPVKQYNTIKPNKVKAEFTFYIGGFLYYMFYFMGLKKASQKVALLFSEVNYISDNYK